MTDLKPHERTMLIILDGWGHSPDPAVSAIDQAETPFTDSLYNRYPNAELITHGLDVGLPPGQMGNSEVGHLNIGAGRVVDQELVRIGKAIASRKLHRHPVLLEAIRAANTRAARIHLMGLVSDGGVHSHIDHLKALCEITNEEAAVPVYLHVFTDGRDVDPHSGLGFMQDICAHASRHNALVVSVIGRYFAMDRDRRWERTRKAYDLLVHGRGAPVTDILQAIEVSYAAGVTDEFIQPAYLEDALSQPIGRIRDGDLVLFFNFRTDRPRQLLAALSQRDMPEHGMATLPLDVVTMTAYDQAFHGVKVLFDPDNLTQTLGEVLSVHGKTQLRIAETEKYPHVTYFFSGGREASFTGEERILVPSPGVATYDLQPEMSAPEVTEAVMAEIRARRPDFICLNYANPDMVGHTGVFAAAIRAVETVDRCLSRLIPLALEHAYAIVIIADHGNADKMVNPDGSPNTSHTTNPVPVIYVSAQGGGSVLDGRLADIAPTLLHLLGIPKPDTMTGTSLIDRS